MIMNTVKASLLSLIALALAFAASPHLQAGSMTGAGGGTDAAMEREAKSPERSVAAEKAAEKPMKAVVKPVGKTAGKTTPESKAEPKTASKAGTASGAKTGATSGAKTVPAAALDLTPTQQDKLLALLNEGTAVELAAISGIAATRAGAIVGARPFQKVHEVILVPGVGEATFDRIIRHGKTLTRAAAKSAKS